ncbi:MAG TPA: HlyD family secretion protein [Longimicrobiales bacterium]|nr:HlyD family secretion protein [Longimicrobiales bacterium]
MNNRVALTVGIVVVLLILGWGGKKWLYSRSHVSTDNAQIGGHLVPVLAKVGGYVGTVAVTENQAVQLGQTLIEIEPDELKQRVAQAEADLAAAEAAAGIGGTGQAQAQVTVAERQRSSFSAQIQAARSNALKADHDLERIQGLADKQIVSRQQLDAARAAAEAAHSTVAALEQQQSGASASITGAQAGVRLAQARVLSARAALESARLQLSYARINAPVSGIVAKRSVEPGQLLQPGQAIMTIVADSGVFVNANFKETQMAKMHVGENVDFHVDAYGCSGKGQVESISAATGSQFALLPADNASGNFTKVVQRVPVRIRVTEGCGKERPLRPGMSVEVHVATK